MAESAGDKKSRQETGSWLNTMGLKFRSNAFLPPPGALEIVKPGKQVRGLDHGALHIAGHGCCHG
ncbi:MAG: hypothetical protein KGK01_13785, partial [Bradyrhizobium sp.]|nr:hypothetical protein [Bradyrhizobium sp.]